jgi:outer membrane protein assembly factor BamB
VVSSPAIGSDGKIYFGSHDRKFYALEPDGTKAWEYVTGGAIISSPALNDDGTAYITSVDGFFYALNSGGSLKWRLQTGGITESSPVIGRDDTLYVGVNSKLWAISLNGQKKWEREATTYEESFPIEATPLALSDGHVCVVSSLGLLSSINQSEPIKWIFHLQGQAHSCPGIDSSGTIYIGGAVFNVGLFFYALPGGTPLAMSPWPKFRCNARNTGNITDAHR